MSKEVLNEDIQNLFRDLLLQEDLDGERKLLQENGVDVDEKSLEEFHKKKGELFAFAKENKGGLQKLDVKDMASVSGGAPNFLHALAKSAATMFLTYLSDGEVSAEDLFLDALVDVGVGLITDPVTDALWEKWKAFSVTVGLPDDPELLTLQEH